MKTACRACGVVVAWAALGWLAAAAPASAQDPMAVARELYASARYEEALGVLDRLRAGERPDLGDVAVEKYRSLCLLALGRDSEAEAAIAEVVSIDPSYLPDATEVAPSVRSFFRTVRQRLLPDIAQAQYAEAKASYERRDFARAAEQFRRTIALLDDPDMAGRLADLRLLAEGFAELSAAAAPAAPPATGSADGPMPAAAPPSEQPADAPRVYGGEDAAVSPPVVVRQVVPAVPSGIQAVGRTRGVYEITIDEGGRVTAVVVRASVHAVYDRAFIESAATWQYRPALLDGRPVKYRKRIQVSVAR